MGKVDTVRRTFHQSGVRGVTRLVLRKLSLGTSAGAEIRPQDKYLDWLCFANAGMLHRGNVYCIEHALQNLPSTNPVLEIGSFCGLSTNVISYYMKRHGVTNKLITCDKWQFEGAEKGGNIGESGISRDEYRTFVRDTFMRNVRMFSRAGLPNTVEMFSDELFTAWREGKELDDVFGRPVQLGGALSFCYIDGNHSYDFVRRDFVNCHEHLDRSGFLLFDDSADGSGWDVCSVVDEVRRSGDYELVARNPNYLFRKK